MNTDRKAYHYDLPPELIAQQPADRRDRARLMQLLADGSSSQHSFYQLPELLRAGDCLVLNNSKVLPARLLGRRRDSGLAVEVLLLRQDNTSDWQCMVRPGRRIKPGHELVFLEDELTAEVLGLLPDGNRLIRFKFTGNWDELLARSGQLPLPPYISEKPADPGRYQTVYAKNNGSAAAPTAGLHFTPELLDALKNKGIRLAELTLHVGPGTFRPVKTANILEHKMHAEYYELEQAAADLIKKTRTEGGRIVAVGTTSCRVLETLASQGGIRPARGWTDIFIYPGYQFQLTDLLITNFHLPESTLLMLVAAFCGREQILAAYQAAIRQAYRFYSFGDAMLLWPQTKGDKS